MTASVSVILSVYRSEETLARSLAALRRQSFADFEVIVVDSSPDASCERIVTEQFEEFQYVRADQRLSADAARNLGFERAAGRLFATTDPDAYPRRDWLENLVTAYERSGGLIIGAVACYGERWLDLGSHLCKFDKWLPGGRPRPMLDGATVNMLIPGGLLESVGGRLIDGHGDTDLCWRLRERGNQLWLEPRAVVEHHHLHSLETLIRERYLRGQEYGALWLHWHPVSAAGRLWRLLITVVPIRLMLQMLRVGRNAAGAGMLAAYFWTIPIVAAGLYAWLLGEARTLFRASSGAVHTSSA